MRWCSLEAKGAGGGLSASNASSGGPTVTVRASKARLRSLISTERQEDLLFLKDLIEAGKVRPVISRANPLSEERGCVSPQGLPEKVPGDGGAYPRRLGCAWLSAAPGSGEARRVELAAKRPVDRRRLTGVDQPILDVVSPREPVQDDGDAEPVIQLDPPVRRDARRGVQRRLRGPVGHLRGWRDDLHRQQHIVGSDGVGAAPQHLAAQDGDIGDEQPRGWLPSQLQPGRLHRLPPGGQQLSSSVARRWATPWWPSEGAGVMRRLPSTIS